MKTRLTLFAAMITILLACEEKRPVPLDEPPTNQCDSPAECVDLPEAVDERPSAGEPLQWKRHAIVVRDLFAALELNQGGLDGAQTQDLLSFCADEGAHPAGNPCDGVFRVALGGNDPFVLGMYQASPAPTVTTRVAMDRLVLKACERRVTADKGLPDADRMVFGGVDFDTAVNAETATTIANTLYRRLLARLPSEKELEEIQGLQGTLSDAERFSLAVCYAVGTTTEFLFF